MPFLIKMLNVSVKNEPAVAFSSYEIMSNLILFFLF